MDSPLTQRHEIERFRSLALYKTGTRGAYFRFMFITFRERKTYEKYMCVCETNTYQVGAATFHVSDAVPLMPRSSRATHPVLKP